jgi:hypothetical protein
MITTGSHIAAGRDCFAPMKSPSPNHQSVLEVEPDSVNDKVLPEFFAF